mmetsp:Transcript_20663/g.57391  ORF Transcript_20663/g.57391 Transcript_20663/m.57391 type:complete len:237 (-) Transcript_20663:764-1474(-)
MSCNKKTPTTNSKSTTTTLCPAGLWRARRGPPQRIRGSLFRAHPGHRSMAPTLLSRTDEVHEFLRRSPAQRQRQRQRQHPCFCFFLQYHRRRQRRSKAGPVQDTIDRCSKRRSTTTETATTTTTTTKCRCDSPGPGPPETIRGTHCPLHRQGLETGGQRPPPSYQEQAAPIRHFRYGRQRYGRLAGPLQREVPAGPQEPGKIPVDCRIVEFLSLSAKSEAVRKMAFRAQFSSKKRP